MSSVALRVATAISLFWAAPAAAEMRLVMVEEAGCTWCKRWHEEIGPIYPKTEEGAAAPLLRVDIHETAASGIAFDRRLSFTPTFVLIMNDAEVSRLEGYPGEDFFWPIVSDMIDTAEQRGEG